MITVSNGQHSFLSDEDAEKLKKYDEIVKLLAERSPYRGNRETCDMTAIEWLLILLILLILGTLAGLLGLIAVIGNYNDEMERRFRQLEKQSMTDNVPEKGETAFKVMWLDSSNTWVCPICGVHFVDVPDGKIHKCPSCHVNLKGFERSVSANETGND